MKDYKYLVKFVTGEWEFIFTGNEQTAKILAQAEQIKKGNNYTILRIRKII